METIEALAVEKLEAAIAAMREAAWAMRLITDDEEIQRKALEMEGAVNIAVGWAYALRAKGGAETAETTEQEAKP